ncbi:MAG: site-specific integrase [Acidimicrobiia bacterium]|nr:site-specific integrase [Acidimicrobiia bacterium]
MARRPKGDGSIFYDEAKGRWVGTLNLGTINGRRNRRKVSGQTKAEAAKRLAALRNELDAAGTVTAANVTFGEVLTSWLDRSETRVQPSTLDNYRNLAETHLAPTLAKKQVTKLRPEDLEAVLKRMSRDGYRKATMSKVRMIAKQALDSAVKRRAVSWNPFLLAELPKVQTADRERSSLTADQARSVIAAAAEYRNGALIAVGLTTGLRPSELTALTWDAIDLGGGTVHVWQAWKGEGDERVLAEPKTAGSTRTLALAPVAVEALAAHRQVWLQERMAGRWPTTWDEHGGLCFVTEVGTPLDPANLRRLFRYVAKAAGVERFTPYTMRHTATSLLADAGARNEELADMLGHRTTRMVELHYRHRLKPVVDVAAGPMQQIFGQ